MLQRGLRGHLQDYVNSPEFVRGWLTVEQRRARAAQTPRTARKWRRVAGRVGLAVLIVLGVLAVYFEASFIFGAYASIFTGETP